MSESNEKTVGEAVQNREITFTCKFCGENKPLSDLVVMRQYYPQITACKTCAIGTRNVESDKEESEV
jgi:transcription elongation factor Elf1